MAAEKYALDGVSYTITVTTREDGFSGAWECSKCQVSGTPTKSCVSVAEAVARSQARLFSEHHFDAHLKIKDIPATVADRSVRLAPTGIARKNGGPVKASSLPVGKSRR
jgi:hypothetical protein